MSTDIYLSKATHEGFVIAVDSDQSYGGSVTLSVYHKPCHELIFNEDASEQHEINHWDFMEAMSQHVRNCGATFTRKQKK